MPNSLGFGKSEFFSVLFSLSSKLKKSVTESINNKIVLI